MKNSNLAMIAAVALAITACKKDEETPPSTPSQPSTTGSVTAEFDMVFGTQPFELNTSFTHPMTGDELTFTMFRFYLSNVRLQKSDGTWWTEPDSYRIIDAATDEGHHFHIEDVPTGSYTAMEYVLGVDSTHNVSGAQTGALSPTNNMFWSWNSGYIMLKAEGTSPQSSSGNFMYHLGGFSGSNSVVRAMHAHFGGDTLTVVSSGTPVVKLQANIARLWHNTGTSVATTSTVHMPGLNAFNMATGFFDDVTFTGLE